MMSREQFGDYLLLKKLAEDPLGESFRAGRVGQQGMQQVVLLRVFNGSAVDGQDLWPKVRERGEVQAALKSPHIGNGVDLGEVHHVPYVAYDYISGKSLAALFHQARSRNSLIPTDHALLIAERLALGLALAYETRVQGERILHGFLVPQLVMLSNEGENRLLAFELAPGLRALATSDRMRTEFGRYLAPEARAGKPISKTDDVYSLGAVLLELLVGSRVPSREDGSEAGADIAGYLKGLQEKSSVAPALWDLLEESLVPADQRIDDVVVWHKQLSKILVDQSHRSTTFNIAFFMHNLFRDDIEQENKEIEVEKTLDLSVSQSAEPSPAADKSQPAAAGADLPQKPPPAKPVEAPRKRSGLRTGLLATAALALVAAGTYGGFLYWQKMTLPQGSAEVTEIVPATEPAEPLFEAADLLRPETPAGPSPEEIREQIDAIIAERAKEMEESLRAEYDDKVRRLTRQLEETQRARAQQQTASASRPEPRERQPEPEEASLSVSRQPAAPVTQAALQAATDSQLPKPESRTEVEEPAPATAPDEPLSGPLAQTTSTSSAGAAANNPPPLNPEPKTPSVPNDRPQPVKVGELVEAGPGVRPPKLRTQLEPRYPAMARKMKKEGTVQVRVLVDESGAVVASEVDGRSKAGFGFETAALQAAKRGKFQPAVKNGVPVKMWTVLRIDFRLE